MGTARQGNSHYLTAPPTKRRLFRRPAPLVISPRGGEVFFSHRKSERGFGDFLEMTDTYDRPGNTRRAREKLKTHRTCRAPGDREKGARTSPARSYGRAVGKAPPEPCGILPGTPHHRL